MKPTIKELIDLIPPRYTLLVSDFFLIISHIRTEYSIEEGHCVDMMRGDLDIEYFKDKDCNLKGFAVVERDINSIEIKFMYPNNKTFLRNLIRGYDLVTVYSGELTTKFWESAGFIKDFEHPTTHVVGYHYVSKDRAASVSTIPPDRMEIYKESPYEIKDTDTPIAIFDLKKKIITNYHRDYTAKLFKGNRLLSQDKIKRMMSSIGRDYYVYGPGIITIQDVRQLTQAAGWMCNWRVIRKAFFKKQIEFFIEAGLLIGFAVVSKNKICLSIDLLIIHPKYQGKGFGTKAVRHLIQDKNMVVVEPILETVGFWKKVGFIEAPEKGVYTKITRMSPQITTSPPNRVEIHYKTPYDIKGGDIPDMIFDLYHQFPIRLRIDSDYTISIFKDDVMTYRDKIKRTFDYAGYGFLVQTDRTPIS